MSNKIDLTNQTSILYPGP